MGKVAAVAGPSLQQAIFTLVSFVATAYVAREAGIKFAAVCFAAYAFQSVVATGLRAYLVRGFTFVHESAQLCRGDVVVAASRVAIVAGVWMVASISILPLISELTFLQCLSIATWTTAATLSDVFRAMVAVFAPNIRDFMACIASLCAVLGIAFLGRPSAELFLILLAVVLLFYGWSSLFLLYAGSLRLKRCKVWRQSAHVCWTFVVEDGTYAIAPALTLLAFSLRGPDLAIGLQLATQAILSPAGLVAYGAGIYLLRSVGARERSSRTADGLILSWIAIVGGVNASLLIFAETAGSGLFVHIFGPKWEFATSFLLPAVTFFVVTECCRVWANKYRAKVSSTVMRALSMSSVLLGQSTVILVLVFTPQSSDVSTSFYIAATVVLIYSVGWFAALQVKLGSAGPRARSMGIENLQVSIDERAHDESRSSF